MTDGDVPDSPFEPVDEDTEDPTGMDSGGLSGPAGNPISRAFDGSVDGPPVSKFEQDYGLEQPEAIGLRGVVRMATGSGVPPIGELLLAGVLRFYRSRPSEPETDTDEDTDEIVA